jgi:hypothetical protein
MLRLGVIRLPQIVLDVIAYSTLASILCSPACSTCLRQRAAVSCDRSWRTTSSCVAFVLTLCLTCAERCDGRCEGCCS